jgi:hypothetical protein
VEKRKQRRTRKRLTCELVIGSERHGAVVRDVAPTGLFVQTRIKLEPDTRVCVVISARAEQPELQLDARVARQRVVPPRLQSSVPGGVGLEVIDPPRSFQEFVASRIEPGAKAASSRAPQEKAGSGVRTFRVRVKQRDKPNSRIITVRSESLHGARARALARAGRGWQIADIQEI